MWIVWCSLALLLPTSSQIISAGSAIASLDESRVLSTGCTEALKTEANSTMSWVWCGSNVKLLLRDGVLSLDATLASDVVTLVLKDPLKLFVSARTGSSFSGLIYALQQSIANPDLRSLALQSQVEDKAPSTATSIPADALLSLRDSSLLVLGEFRFVRTYADSSLQLLSQYQPVAAAVGDRLLVIFQFGDALVMGKTSPASQIIRQADHSLITSLPTAVHGSSAVNRYATMLQDSSDPSSVFAFLQADGSQLLHKYHTDSMSRGSLAPLAAVDVTAYGLSNNILNFGPYQYVVTIPSVTASAALTGFYTLSKQHLKLDFHLLPQPIVDRTDAWTGFRAKADSYYFSLVSLADRCLQSYYLLVDSCIERDANNTCLKCIDGYYRQSSSCLNVSSLLPRFGVSGDSVVACYDDNCMNCSDNYQICTECDTSRGYILANGACNHQVPLSLMAAYDTIDRQVTLYANGNLQITALDLALEDVRSGLVTTLRADEFQIRASHGRKTLISINSVSSCAACILRLVNRSASSIKDGSSGAIFRGYPIEQGPLVFLGRDALLFSVARLLLPMLSVLRYLAFLHSWQLGIWYGQLLENLAHLYHMDGSEATPSDFLLQVVSRVGVLPFPVFNPLRNEDSIRSCVVDKRLSKKMIYCAIGDSYGQNLFAIYLVLGLVLLTLAVVQVLTSSTTLSRDKLAKTKQRSMSFGVSFLYSCHMNLMYFGLNNLLNHDEFVKGMVGWFIGIKFLVLYAILFINMALHSRRAWAKLQAGQSGLVRPAEAKGKQEAASCIESLFPQPANPAYSAIVCPLVVMVRSLLVTLLSVVLFKYQTVLAFVSLAIELSFVGYLNYIGSAKTNRLMHLLFAVYFLFCAICSFDLSARVEQSALGWLMCSSVIIMFLLAAVHCVASTYKKKKTAVKSTCTGWSTPDPDSPDLNRQDSGMVYSIDGSVVRDKSKHNILSRRKNLKLSQVSPSMRPDRSDNPFEKYKQMIFNLADSASSQPNT